MITSKTKNKIQKKILLHLRNNRIFINKIKVKIFFQENNNNNNKMVFNLPSKICGKIQNYQDSKKNINNQHLSLNNKLKIKIINQEE